MAPPRSAAVDSSAVRDNVVDPCVDSCDDPAVDPIVGRAYSRTHPTEGTREATSGPRRPQRTRAAGTILRMQDHAATGPGFGPWRSGTAVTSFRPFPDAAAEASVTERLVAMADAHPERTALSSPAGSWTYAKLIAEVRSGAGALIDRVGEAAVPVGVLATHDGPLVIAILSVIAAGHIVVVLDPLAPLAQHEHVLAECRPALVLHDEAHTAFAAELAAASGIPVAGLGELLAAEPADSRRTLPARASHDPMMLAFTSGTSGAPKGGIITHGVLMNLVRGATNALGITAADRMPMLFPTSLAVAAYPLFLPLLNGGTLATLDVRSVGLAPVADFLETERITLAYLAPTVVRFLVDALAGRTFPDLRMVALGGELVDAEVVGLTRELFGPELLANGYGTTETGVITLYVIDPDESTAGAMQAGAVPAGYAVPDVELFILDDHGEPVGPGDSGEIAVSSPYVFAGYWGHPELNRRVLAPDPGGRPRWRLYRTGDFGSIDDHGALVVSGRLDTKVKIRGRFVVLGDVEARLHELEGIASAAVVALERDGVNELVAYVVAVPDSERTGAEHREILLGTEEAYRVPSRWVFLDELPRLPNGKTDRRALPDPDVVGGTDHSSTSEHGSDAADHDRIRGALLRIWESLLPVGSMTVDEDFFHLGGDSLLAAQMLVQAEIELGVTVPMGEIVHARTIRSLAEVIVRIEAATTHRSTVSCVQRGNEATRPRLWFVHDLQGSAFRIRHLAEALGADQPVWSFESPLLRGEPNPYSSLETFVARYLTDLRAAQPEGPYWLAGYSFGGICAYEMARQLRRDGAEVAFVGVVDVGPGYRGPGWHGSRSPLRPWFGVAKPPAAGSSPLAVLRRYREMYAASPSGTARHLMIRTGLSRWIDPLRFRADLRAHGRVRPEWRLWYSWEEHWKLAAKAWDRARTYAGTIDLFWADESAASDATMGWAPLVGNVRIHRFAGDHQGVLEPSGVTHLAPVLRRALDDRVEDRS